MSNRVVYLVCRLYERDAWVQLHLVVGIRPVDRRYCCPRGGLSDVGDRAKTRVHGETSCEAAWDLESQGNPLTRWHQSKFPLLVDTLSAIDDEEQSTRRHLRPG